MLEEFTNHFHSILELGAVHVLSQQIFVAKKLNLQIQ